MVVGVVRVAVDVTAADDLAESEDAEELQHDGGALDVVAAGEALEGVDCLGRVLSGLVLVLQRLLVESLEVGGEGLLELSSGRRRETLLHPHVFRELAENLRVVEAGLGDGSRLSEQRGREVLGLGGLRRV